MLELTSKYRVFKISTIVENMLFHEIKLSVQIRTIVNVTLLHKLHSEF